MKTAVVIMVFLLGFSLFILARAHGQGGAGANPAQQLPLYDDPQQALADAKARGCCILLVIGARG